MCQVFAGNYRPAFRQIRERWSRALSSLGRYLLSGTPLFRVSTHIAKFLPFFGFDSNFNFPFP